MTRYVNDALAPMLAKFPRAWLHEGVNGRGWPLVVNGAVDPDMLKAIARFSVWSVSPIDLYDNLDLRAATLECTGNVSQVRLAHVLGPRVWSAAPGGWAGRLWASIPYDRDHMCFTTTGERWESFVRIDNPAVRDALFSAYAELLHSGCFEGLVLDWMTLDDSWMYASNPTLDLSPWGGNLEAWRDAFRTGKQQLVTRLRLAFPHAILVGNGGPRGYVECNGWFRENFPQQNGGTWESNVTGPLGIAHDADFYGVDQLGASRTVISPICLARNAMPQVDDWGFALASSCIGDGALVVGPSNFTPTLAASYARWWNPLYAQDRKTHAAIDGPANGWLGVPLAPTYRVNDGSAAATWRRDFTYGYVNVNPTTRAWSIDGK